MDEDTLSEAMSQWRNGTITNWEYLMRLNGLGGRSYNDLMQYPVLPFVLADYTSRVLDLTAPETFRDLTRPMAVQHKSREQHYINTYNVSGCIYVLGCERLNKDIATSLHKLHCVIVSFRTASLLPWHFSSPKSDEHIVIEPRLMSERTHYALCTLTSTLTNVIRCVQDLKAARREGCSPVVARQPHHYASLYSNSGGVLHYLVRLPPFTELFLNYQGECVLSFTSCDVIKLTAN